MRKPATHPECSPSRAGLMSGMNQNYFGVEDDSGPECYADTNKDGQHSREEYPQKDLFDAVDANQYGQAALKEMRAYYAPTRSAK